MFSATIKVFFSLKNNFFFATVLLKAKPVFWLKFTYKLNINHQDCQLKTIEYNFHKLDFNIMRKNFFLNICLFVIFKIVTFGHP